MKVKTLTISLLFAATCAFAQLAQPSLEEIKAAAEAGDPAAQDKLAERFVMRADSAQAEVWYRKSAAQGYAHAQGQLGHMLYIHTRTSIGLKPDARAAMGDEAVKWLTLAANQGNAQAQADLADICLQGKLVKQDLIEAYKWGELATHGGGVVNFPGIEGRSARDSAILKMTSDQIEEGKRRVAAFKPHTPQKSEMPVPAWVKQIKLTGISGGPDKRFAIIGKETLEQGESRTIKIGGNTVTIKCLEITDTTATISVDGIDGTQTLSLN